MYILRQVNKNCPNPQPWNFGFSLFARAICDMSNKFTPCKMFETHTSLPVYSTRSLTLINTHSQVPGPPTPAENFHLTGWAPRGFRPTGSWVHRHRLLDSPSPRLLPLQSYPTRGRTYTQHPCKSGTGQSGCRDTCDTGQRKRCPSW